MQRAMRIAAIIAGVLVLAGVGGYFIWQGQKDRLPSDIATGNGRIEAVQVDVSAKIAGRVKQVLVREGDMVKPGQVLARMDTAQLEAQRLQAVADAARARSEVAAAEANVGQAEAQLHLMQSEFDRTKTLFDQGNASQEALDVKQSSLISASTNLDVTKASLTAAQRAVDASDGVVTEIETQIADAELVSPALGRVIYRLAEPGEVLASGGKVLTLIDFSDIYMELYLPALEAARVPLGGEARLRVDALDMVIPATVTFVSPISQFTPKQVETISEREKLMFRVKASLPEKLVLAHVNIIKTGVRGEAYIRLASETASAWPDNLSLSPKVTAALQAQ